jgi:hypothetical protein
MTPAHFEGAAGSTLNFAATCLSELTVRAQSAVPVQTIRHPENNAPRSFVARSVARAPFGTLNEHVVGEAGAPGGRTHLMPSPERSSTTPEAVPSIEIVTRYVAGSNRAVAVRAWVMERVHVGAAPHPPPPSHCLKIDAESAGVAVRVTELPYAASTRQPSVDHVEQLETGPPETDPTPAPTRFTVSCSMLGWKLAVTERAPPMLTVHGFVVPPQYGPVHPVNTLAGSGVAATVTESPFRVIAVQVPPAQSSSATPSTEPVTRPVPAPATVAENSYSAGSNLAPTALGAFTVKEHGPMPAQVVDHPLNTASVPGVAVIVTVSPCCTSTLHDDVGPTEQSMTVAPPTAVPTTRPEPPPAGLTVTVSARDAPPGSVTSAAITASRHSALRWFASR